MRWSIVLGLVLAGGVARADPEGYRGGEGRAPGTPYVVEGLSFTVRETAVAVVRSGTWSCGGVDVRPTGGMELVTVSLVVANRTSQRVSTHLANMDLVFAPAGAAKDGEVAVQEGACAREGHATVSDVALRAHQTRTVPVQFLIPRRATAKILVYNDDDFPALFALPAAKRKPR